MKKRKKKFREQTKKPVPETQEKEWLSGGFIGLNKWTKATGETAERADGL